MADSRHNKYVSVTDWFKPAPGSTTSGTVSGSTGAATSGASFVGGSWGSGGSGGGQTITIIKTNDTTPESNSNVYSALRVHNSFIAKDKDERTEGKLSSDVGFEVGEFVSGVSGAICYVDPETLQTTAELDRLKVRVKAYFETLEIVNVNSVGGKQIISPAGSINCIRVDEHGGTIDIQKERQATDEEGNPLYDINGNPIMETYIESVDNGVPEDTYRCYFLAEQDGETIENRFHVGDQAYSQMFDAQPGISSNVSSKYYWRLVTGISYDPIEIAGKKYHYIDLSVSDCDTDSDAPSVGDIICHRGHRTLPGDIEGRDRQNALEFSAVDTFSPSITLYQGIGESDPDNGKYPYSLVGKDIIQYGVNRLNNRAFMNVYGDMYVGDRDGQSYLQFDETAGLTVKGNIQFGSKSKMEGDDLTLEERIELASKAYEEDVNQFKAAVEKSFSDVQNQIDGAIETYFLDPEPTLENEPAIDWNTDQIKAAHVGDLYYSKQGNAYRFQYDEITDDDGSKHNLYYWNLIKDTDITLALANAQKAQDTADSKRKIFVKQPSTNDSYEEGDMWANATYPATGVPKYSNDLLRAITSKQAGEPFNINHWVLSSKYTDDTAAIAAQEAADEAQRAANNAQSDATAAANRLSSWAADNVISPTEKQGIKEEYVRVIKDKDSIHEQWDQYFLDTTGNTEIGKIYIAYNNAYLPYVEQLIYLFTAKDSDGVALENIPIPDDFDDNQTAYYSNRAIALNTIAAAAKKVADDAQAAADNAYEEAEKALTAAEEAKTSVYGLNTTVTGLKDFTDDAFLDGIINSSERKTIENYIYQINTVLAQVQQSYSEVVDNTFLVESVAKTNLENSYNSFITATNELLQTVNVISNQGSVENIDRAGFEVKYNNFNSKYSDYTKYLNAAIKFIEYAINSRVDTTLQELGGYSYLKNAFNEETTVTGGLVLTSLVALGYTDDNQQYHVMGGINGSHANNDGIAIWAGGSAVDRAIEPNNPNAADFLVRMDGTGYAAGGNFWWESDGTIHADPLSFVISESSVGALLSSLKVYYNVTNSKPSPYALEPLVPFTKLTIASDIELNSNARISFGDVYLAYDNVNNSVYIANQNGSPVNFYISGGISMYSAGSMTSTSIMDIIAQNIDTNTLQINDQGLLTVIGGGTGGGGSIDYPLSWSGFSSGSFDGSAAKTIYIPSKLSELTNDSGYALSSALSGYLPLSGGTINGNLFIGSEDNTGYKYLRIRRNNSKVELSSNGSAGVLNYDGVGFVFDKTSAKWNSNTLIHSGNIGSQSVSYASNAGQLERLSASDFGNWFSAGKYDLNETRNGFRAGKLFGASNAVNNSSSYRGLLEYGVNGYIAQFNSDSNNDLYYRWCENQTWKPWRTVAFEDSNVASATKLKNARTLWGQSFDGSKNVDGDITIKGALIGKTSTTDALESYMGNASGGVNGDGALMYAYGSRNLYFYTKGTQRMIVDSSGNVGIGTTSPSTKLHVNGGSYSSSNPDNIVADFDSTWSSWGYDYTRLAISFNGEAKGIIGWNSVPITAATDVGLHLYNRVSGAILSLGNDSNFYFLGNGNVGIGTKSPQYKLDVNGSIFSETFIETKGKVRMNDYLWLNLNGEGIYITSQGISWHNSSNAWSSSLIGFAKNSISLNQPTSIDSTLSVSGAATLNNSVYLANKYSIYTKDTGGTSRAALALDSDNNFIIGNDIAGAGYNTYLSGKTVCLRYGTSRTTGLTLGSDGAVSIAKNLTVGTFIKAQSLELSMTTPFIDFHFNNSTADYTSRIIEAASGVLTCIGKWTVNGALTASSTLSVSSTSTFTGNTTNKAIAYFANGTTYYIDASGAAKFASLTSAGAIKGTSGSFSSTLAVTSTSTFTGKTTHNGGLESTVSSAYAIYGNSSTARVCIAGDSGKAMWIGSTSNSASNYIVSVNYGLSSPSASSGGYNAFVIRGDGNVGIGQNSPSAKLHVAGNILCTGQITMNSMRSMKNIIGERVLSLSELSIIKPTRFTWKDGRDDRVHVGGIADDVMKVLPEVVFKGNDGVLSMDYASAAFVMAASLIQPMTEHERRIANLERENALLKKEIERLKRA